jgi:hypothetical protein
VCRVTEIVNQPFPSKVHALTGRVNRHSGVLRGSTEAYPHRHKESQFIRPYALRSTLTGDECTRHVGQRKVLDEQCQDFRREKLGHEQKY